MLDVFSHSVFSPLLLPSLGDVIKYTFDRVQVLDPLRLP